MTTLQNFRRTVFHCIDVGRKRRQLRREFAQLDDALLKQRPTHA